MRMERDPCLLALWRTLHIWDHASAQQPVHAPVGPEARLPRPTTFKRAARLHDGAAPRRTAPWHTCRVRHLVGATTLQKALAPPPGTIEEDKVAVDYIALTSVGVVHTCDS
ncbi:hypothetical protein NDU88_008074 [Pleurodeles waltl]|uniref:Uncharacterized protein n=1 Tax=Pleurodeles waltl TaxID=8319 RepID=A0AAV7RVU9_PLEWA|nr:hypothetical protein NDU88_008074 [Pleurodeles waltl]